MAWISVPTACAIAPCGAVRRTTLIMYFSPLLTLAETSSADGVAFFFSASVAAHSPAGRNTTRPLASAAAPAVVAGAALTVTFTRPLVQQHWNPPPPSPDESLATTRSQYSPGSENFAVVVERCDSASMAGFAFSNVTAPAPRYLLHVNRAGGPGGGLRLLDF